MAVLIVGLFFVPAAAQSRSEAYLLKDYTGSQAKTPSEILAQSLHQSLSVLFLEDPVLVKKFYTDAEKRQALVDDKNALIMAELLFHEAVVKLMQGDEASGAWKIIKSFNQLKEVPSTNPAANKLRGLFQVIFGMVPSNYTWVRRTLGFEGNINKGIEMLKSYAASSQEDALEAKCFLMYTYFFLIEPNQKNKAMVTSLLAEAQKSQLLTIVGATSALRLQEANLAEKFLKNKPQGEGYLNPPIFSRLNGDVALFNGDEPTAIAHYNKYLAAMKGKAFKGDVVFKKGAALLISNNEAAALKTWQQIPANAGKVHEKDKYALRFFNKQIKTNTKQSPDIFRGRFTFDGGQFSKAFEIFSAIDNQQLSAKQQEEKYYRMGRAKQLLNSSKDAIEHFNAALKLSDIAENEHFGAMAALQLGFIYAQSGQKDQAKKHFLLAQQYKNNEFSSSINLKAKIELKKL